MQVIVKESHCLSTDDYIDDYTDYYAFYEELQDGQTSLAILNKGCWRSVQILIVALLYALIF
jgi:hypothetical protein